MEERRSLLCEAILPLTHSSIGLLRADRGDFRAAAEQFRLAANWNPQQQDVDYNLGLAIFSIRILSETRFLHWRQK